jgi:plasmid stabilization system protein ParE
MSGYQLTPAADADLEEIWQYVCESSGAVRANALEDELHTAMDTLGKSPGIGHLRHDLADEALRIWTVHKFLIVYRPEIRPVQVVRVLHGARDLQAILGGSPVDPPAL